MQGGDGHRQSWRAREKSASRRGSSGDGRSGLDQSDPRAKPKLKNDSAELSSRAVGKGLKQKRDRGERGGKEDEKTPHKELGSIK